ncbi:MAG: twin-arginine translocase TatA/TatE family subunit [Paraperlucidibaca sp.]
MFSGLSLPHILLLLVIVVLLFGTSKLKNLGKDLGGAIKGFKESMNGDDDATPKAPEQKVSHQPHDHVPPSDIKANEPSPHDRKDT